MQEAADQSAGGMAAVLGLDWATVTTICAEASNPGAGPAEVVVAANENAPGQQVISGGLAALERAGALARERGARRVVPLKVAGAFHSPLMEPAVDRLTAALAQTPVAPCRFPVIANSSAASLETLEAIREELPRQVTAPVRWVESVRALAAWEPDLWVDSGPGSVVAGLLARIVPGAEARALSALLDTPDPA
jgi:[acyl-carrier-protein] S-malonyltransferase